MSTICRDCGLDAIEIGEWYMVHHAVWEQACRPEDVLYIGCLEQRLGRKLRVTDFNGAPVNDPTKASISDRLRDRLSWPAVKYSHVA